MEKLVVVIPAFNERENIDNLVNSLEKLAASFNEVRLKVVFVDDGSVDGTGEYFLERIKKSNVPFKVIFLSRNFGKDSAVRTGLGEEEGDYYVIVDADGQTPLSYIPLMYKKLKETGVEVCSACKRKEAYRFPRKFLSALFFFLVKLLKVKELRGGYSDFKLFTRKVRDCVLSSQERDMVVRNYIEWMKFPETTIEFIPVKSRKTSFSFSRLFFLGLKSIFYFSPVLLRFNFVPLCCNNCVYLNEINTSFY